MSHKYPPKPIQWDHETLTRFWQYYSQFPESYFSYQFGDSIVKKLKRFVRPNASVLDYGSGPGFLADYLLNTGFGVTCAEVSLDGVSGLSSRCEGRRNFKGVFTIQDLLDRGMTFDAIFLIEVIEHLDDSQLEVCLANLHRLLRPEGVVLFTTPNEERLEENIVYCPVSNVTFHRWQHVRSWSVATLAAALREAGFKIHNVGTTDFTYAYRGFINVAMFKVARLLRAIRRKDPSLFAVVCSDR